VLEYGCFPFVKCDISPRKKGRPCKRWRDEVEEDLNVMQIRNMVAIVETNGEW